MTVLVDEQVVGLDVTVDVVELVNGINGEHLAEFRGSAQRYQ